MNEIDDFYKNLPQGRCKDCKYAKEVVATGQYMFLGCYHSPYFGKRVAEIKDCPRRIDIEIARGWKNDRNS